MYLDDKQSAKVAANILKKFETLVLFEVSQTEQTERSEYEWYMHVTECNRDVVFEVLSMFQTNMFQFKYILEKHIRISVANQLRDRFVGDLSLFTAQRRLSREGDIYVVFSNPPEKVKYSYFLLTDIFLLASLNEKSGKYSVVRVYKTDDIKLHYDETHENQFTVLLYYIIYS